jgi:Flp pilus assembly pilin Flp
VKHLICRMAKEEDGVLSFEWTLVVTVLVIGIVGGVSGARDAIIDEMGDAAEAMIALDQSFSIDFPLIITIDGVSNSSSDSSFVDSQAFTDCGRTLLPTGQVNLTDDPA